MSDQHTLTITKVTPHGYTQAGCSCGWQGNEHWDRSQVQQRMKARADYDRHLADDASDREYPTSDQLRSGFKVKRKKPPL